jgi:hypothetical protein
MRVLIAHHGQLPTAGQPVTGGGLRAWHHGRALQAAGCEVHWLSRDQDGAGGYSSPADLARRAAALAPDAVVCVQAIDAPALRAGLPETPMAVDLYAPRLLESPFEGRLAGEAVIALRALAAGDVFLVSNPRQRLSWMGVLALAGIDVRHDPTRVVGLVAADGPARSIPRTPQLVAGGATWPWQDPVPALRQALEHLELRGKGTIAWYGGAPLIGETKGGWVLPEHPRLKAHGWVARGELLAAYAGSTAAIDWMAGNPEREVALSFRHVDYLGCGLPILSGPNTALADVVGDAGWIVDPLDPAAVRDALDVVLGDKAAVRRASAAARDLARDHFGLAAACQPLVDWVAAPTRHGRAAGPLVDAAEALARAAAAEARATAADQAAARSASEVAEKRREVQAQDERLGVLLGTVDRLSRALDEVAGFKREAVAVLGSREQAARADRDGLERELNILRADLDKKNAELGAMDRLRDSLERELVGAREAIAARGRGGLFRR